MWCLKITRRGFLDKKGLYKTGSRTRTVIPSAIQPVLTQTRHVGTLRTRLGNNKGHFLGMWCLKITRRGFLDEKGLYKTGSRTRTVIPSAIQPVLTQTRHVG